MKNMSNSRIYQTLMIGLFLIFSISCNNNKTSVNAKETGNFTDPRDGKIYKTIKIGEQWIMAENLAYKPDLGNYWAYNNDSNNVKFEYLNEIGDYWSSTGSIDGPYLFFVAKPNSFMGNKNGIAALKSHNNSSGGKSVRLFMD